LQLIFQEKAAACSMRLRCDAVSAEEMAKTKADVEQLNKDIQSLIGQTPKFTPSAEAVSKIKTFIK
jgi:hypothetical protein